MTTSTFPRWKGDVEPPFVFELCRRLTERFQVHVLAPHCFGAAGFEVLDDIRVTRFRYFPARWETLAYRGGILAGLKRNPLRYGLVPLFVLWQYRCIQKMLKQTHYDCIHAHWMIPQGLIAALAARASRHRPPLLVTCHGGDLYGIRGPAGDRLKRWTANRSSCITVVSRAMSDTVAALGVDRAKLQIVPMGCDMRRRFVPPPEKSKRRGLLFVGRLVEKKGLRYLLDAMPHVITRHPEAGLTIVGDGPLKKPLQQHARDIGVGEHVKFVGPVANDSLPAFYQRARALVFPSIVSGDGDREGFGLVLVEALGCECPAVVSDLPAMRDIVRDGETALVVSRRSARDIALKVNRILEEPGLQEKLGKAGRDYVLRHFDWSRIADRYAEIIRGMGSA